jgi:ATP-dependent exoDNAse (exonuclease V) alpha subunit
MANYAELLKMIGKEGLTSNALATDNPDATRAMNLIQQGKNVFITGSAGSGKSTFLKQLKAQLGLKLLVTAYSGVAAVNAGGQTLHSTFGLPLEFISPDDRRLHFTATDQDQQTIYSFLSLKQNKQELIKGISTLVIDEISMVRADIIDLVDRILRAYNNRHLPFGGKQVIFIGDVFQLPPVSIGSELDVLLQFYTSKHFFASRAIQAMLSARALTMVEFSNIFRQKNKEFQAILNRVRFGIPTSPDLITINKQVQPNYTAPYNSEVITITTKNADADFINNSHLNALPGKSTVFKGRISGLFPSTMLPAPLQLELKPGAKVMFLKNNENHGYNNGQIGIVKEVEAARILVESKGRTILVEPAIWTNTETHWDPAIKQTVTIPLGEFTQYPLKLGWATTVHKAQGLTLDKVHLIMPSTFERGMAYVGLSRVRNLEDLTLKHPVAAAMTYPSAEVVAFYKYMKQLT